MVSLLQRLPQCERETKTVHEAESEGDHPPSFDLRADDVLDRHVDDRKRDEHFHEWWKPKRIGRYAQGRSDEGDRVRDGERGHNQYQRTETAERNDETKKKEQMIDSIQDVKEAQLDEPQRRLVPTWIEPHQVPGRPGTRRRVPHR